MNSGQRWSVSVESTRLTTWFRYEWRQGPPSASYWYASMRCASSLVAATVCGPVWSSRVTPAMEHLSSAAQASWTICCNAESTTLSSVDSSDCETAVDMESSNAL